MQGTVKRWISERGYGFIQVDSGKDVFVHHTGVIGKGYKTLVPGQLVEFELTKDEVGRTKATEVKAFPIQEGDINEQAEAV